MAAVAAPPGRPAWSPTARAGFRFAFAYLLLYTLTNVPVLGAMFAPASVWLAIWVAARVLGWALSPGDAMNGSGDTALNYAQVLSVFLLAVLITALWSLLDRRRSAYPSLYAGLRVWLRYYLGAYLLLYGFAKLVPLQFGTLSGARMLQSYGESSPMGLLWTFMAASRPYAFCGGLMECLGGALLLFRRTATLGALVSVAVMANVVMLNFAYDVPVKLFSSHLLLIALFLTLPDAGRLLSVLVLNRPVAARAPERTLRAPWARWTWLGLKTLALVAFTTLSAWQAWRAASRPTGAALPVSGMYLVQTFAGGLATSAQPPDDRRWRRLVIEQGPGQRLFSSDRPVAWLTVEWMNGQRVGAAVTVDPKAATLDLSGRLLGTLRYRQPTPDQLILSGTLDGAPVHVTLSKADDSAQLLTSRGFHWINEEPFNR